MPNTLAQKRQALLAELTLPSTSQSRLALVIERGRLLPSFPPDERTDARLVPGCLSKLWLVADYQDGLCQFRCDSDSAVVKGIAGILCEFYSGAAPAEILATDATFLAEAGITQHLTGNRRNSLSRIQGMIREFAQGCLKLNSEVEG